MRELKVSGMTCGHCEAAVRRALEAVPCVDAVVSVNRDRGIAAFEGGADDAAVIAAIKAEGYEVTAD